MGFWWFCKCCNLLTILTNLRPLRATMEIWSIASTNAHGLRLHEVNTETSTTFEKWIDRPKQYSTARIAPTLNPQNRQMHTEPLASHQPPLSYWYPPWRICDSVFKLTDKFHVVWKLQPPRNLHERLILEAYSLDYLKTARSAKRDVFTVIKSNLICWNLGSKLYC